METEREAAMRSKLIAGNWKMNGDLQMALNLAGQVAAAGGDLGCDLLLCPPFLYLSVVAGPLSGSDVALGGQDCHAEASGAHTGDVSAAMLAEIGCRYVIVGHSERRADHGETDSMVCAKAAAGHEAGLTAIVCVGESEAQRDAGDALKTVEAQLLGSVPEAASAANTVIAYEPIWAIGTGRTPTIDQIAEMHGGMREVLARRYSGEVAEATRLLYGGSVNAGNASDILAIDGVDGALVGGASLKADSFLAIGRSCC